MEKARSQNDLRADLTADISDHEVFFAYCGSSYLHDTSALHVGKVAALRPHLAVKPLHTEMSFQEDAKMVELLDQSKLKSVVDILNVHIALTRTSYSAEIDGIAAADRHGA